MFVDAIEKVQGYTRPIHRITRLYGDNTVEPGAATLFFVNELGYAVTCKHVAILIVQTNAINDKYNKFKQDRDQIPTGRKYNKRLRELEQKHKFRDGIIIQIKNSFMNCVDKMTSFSIQLHPTEDLALVNFEGFKNLSYQGYAIFLKDSSKVKQGKSLCRLGYPFPEFSNYKYDSGKDDIEWIDEGRKNTPQFPIDGIVTRHTLNNGMITGIELSTPGLRGQSGGPLFDQKGIVYGMQSLTHHLHLGFDIKDKEIRENGRAKKVSNYPFLHLGRCVHVDVIKSFLREKNIKFYENED